MRILVIEPGKAPEVREITNSLATLQELVGGYIDAIYPFRDSVALICNDDGKELGLPLNRCLRRGNQIYDVVAGTFLVTGLAGEGFASLTDSQIRTYTHHFRNPEAFIRVGHQLIVLPVPEEAHPDA